MFITEREDVSDLIADTDYRVLAYPSWRCLWFLLRARTVVVDSNQWVWKLSRFLLVGAAKVQLWHGVGYKRVELDKWRHEVEEKSFLSSSLMLAVRNFSKRLSGRRVRFDLVNATSKFYLEKVFRPAFSSRNFIIAGYPRNTFGDLGEPIHALAWKNVEPSVTSRVGEWLSENRRIVLVAPTFRDSRGSPLGLDPETVSSLDGFCERNGFELILNFHPSERLVNEIRGEHIHQCRSNTDLYPLMPLTDALITDYSSIYMDYLLLDKPVLFFVPDLESYISQDRQFQFDFQEMTPGPKLKTWREVMTALAEPRKNDDFAEERARLCKLAFDQLPQEQAVPKLLAFMRGRGRLPPQAVGDERHG